MNQTLQEQGKQASKIINRYRKLYGTKRCRELVLIQQLIRHKYGLFIPVFYDKSNHTKPSELFELIEALMTKHYINGRFMDEEKRR